MSNFSVNLSDDTFINPERTVDVETMGTPITYSCKKIVHNVFGNPLYLPVAPQQLSPGLSNKEFINCDFYHCDFSYGSFLFNCKFIRCGFVCCRFLGINIEDSEFIECMFNTSIIRFCGFSNTSIVDSNFHTTRFDRNDPNVHPLLDGPSYIKNCTFDPDCFVHGQYLNGFIGLEDSIKTAKHIPDAGSFIGWKAAKTVNGKSVIVKLEIPEDAKRVSPIGANKGRCSKAKVVGIQSFSGNQHYKNVRCVSWFDKKFTYGLGDLLTPTCNFDDSDFETCASGIHFFINRDAAVHWGKCNFNY